MKENKDQVIVEFLKETASASSAEIHAAALAELSYATVKRILTRMVSNGLLLVIGKGKGTKYVISPRYELLRPIDPDQYFEREIDQRHIKSGFSFELIPDILMHHSVFQDSELQKLNRLQTKYQENLAQMTDTEYLKELERLAIDLSWKSSQIEGNTYSLLETERLLKDKETAAGKTREEATMLLNHKDALDFIIENPAFIEPLAVRKIEDIHALLVKELAVDRNLRRRRVGISGTNYLPPDNEFKIREALDGMCDLINTRDGVFEKAFLALVLISYIQPFADGNKRTARIISNALLMHRRHCPISFRTVDSMDYKKAMLLFYEQNNLSAMKEIFIGQFEFAVNTYF